MPTIPDALAMRHLKYGGAPEAERERMAEVLRAANRHTEALLLYEGRGGHPSLVSALQRAVSQGLAFRVLSLRRLGAPVTDDHLRACALAAEKAGRWLDARQCHLAVGDAEAVQRLAQHLPESMRPPPPPPPPAEAPAPKAPGPKAPPPKTPGA